MTHIIQWTETNIAHTQKQHDRTHTKQKATHAQHTEHKHSHTHRPNLKRLRHGEELKKSNIHTWSKYKTISHIDINNLQVLLEEAQRYIHTLHIEKDKIYDVNRPTTIARKKVK